MQTLDNDHDSECESSDSDIPRISMDQEIQKLEQIIKRNETSKNSCPFIKPPHATSGLSCPFEFGLREGADSEEEAEVPQGHKTMKHCPNRTCVTETTNDDHEKIPQDAPGENSCCM